MSALLTTTMPGMEKTVQVMRDRGVPARTMIGGAPVTKDYADRIGADGYAAFRVAGGAYRIRASKGAFERIWRYVPIGARSSCRARVW